MAIQILISVCVVYVYCIAGTRYVQSKLFHKHPLLLKKCAVGTIFTIITHCIRCIAYKYTYFGSSDNGVTFRQAWTVCMKCILYGLNVECSCKTAWKISIEWGGKQAYSKKWHKNGNSNNINNKENQIKYKIKTMVSMCVCVCVRLIHCMPVLVLVFYSSEWCLSFNGLLFFFFSKPIQIA